ncbi:S-layer homology domain-containing protein [Paenibacillus agaridevorans]|uniref:S-layer homology domain-containing protein n=1 Tax=Paenibacillus agaridevorans TaxID=171404 RepID=UPI000D59DBE4|nr:S-layer homology domain-containing protein [Paenibacillus agaridevorans]
MKLLEKVIVQAAGLLLFVLIVPAIVFADTVTTIEPDGVDVGFTAYQIFQNSKLGGGPVDGPNDIEHLFETNVSGLGPVFQFHANKYGDYDGGNLDRQRVELKAYNSSNADVKGFENEILTYHWQFRVMPNFQMPPAGAFNHIFQLKAQGGDDGAPILTFTVADDKLYFRHSPIGPTMDEVEVLTSTAWSNVSNTWVDATVTVENAEDGLVAMTLKDLSNGQTLMSYSGNKDNWRDNADINRPKWGIYRKIFSGMNDADIQFAKFEITKHSDTSGLVHPVNLSVDNHIEAEHYFGKQGLSFRQTRDTSRFNDAIMGIPDAWNVSQENNALTYKLNASNSSGSAYIHLLGKAPDLEASQLKIVAGETSIDANVEVGSWGWTTVEIPLTNGEQSISIQALAAGAQLDKFVLNQSATAPASATLLKLNQITLDGQPLPGFSPSVFDYKVNLPPGVSEAPAVHGEASSELVVAVGEEVADANNNPAGTVAITVADPDDSSLTATYSITFNYMRYVSPPPQMVAYPVIRAEGPSVPTRVYDGDITSMWDNKPVGGDDNNANDKYTDIILDLGEVQPLKHAFIGFGSGNNRVSFKFDLLVSTDGEAYTSVFEDIAQWSNGNASDLQQFTFEEVPARYVKFRGFAGKKNNGAGSLEKYNKIREIIFAGDSKLTYDSELYEMDLTTNNSHPISLALTHADGSTLDVTSLAVYQSMDETVARVDENGVITAIANGSTVIEATYGYHKKPINVIVGDAVIIEPPSWPSGSKTQAVEIYKDGVFLTWTAAASHSGIDKYIIYNADSGNILAEAGNVLNTTISGLREATQYNIVIQAVDVGGTASELEQGPKVMFTTRGEAPQPGEPDPEGTIIFEAEDLAEAGQYVLNPSDLPTKSNSEAGASAGGNFQIDFSEETGQSVAFTVHISTAGTYEVHYGYKKKTSRGIFQLSINDEPLGEAVDHYGPDGYGSNNSGSYTFGAEGDYIFKFEIIGKNVDSSGLGFVFDYMKLIPDTSEEPGSENPGSEGPGDNGSGPYTGPAMPSPSNDYEIMTGKDGSAVIKPEVKKNQSTATASVSSAMLNEAAELATADAKGIKTIVLELPLADGVNEYAVELPAQSLMSNGNEYKLMLKTPAGSIQLPNHMLGTAGLAAADIVTVKIAIADKSSIDASLLDQIGDRPVIDIAIVAGGKTINWSNPDAPVTVIIDYEPTVEELQNHEHIVVWYLDGKGKAIAVPSGKYNPDTGKVAFVTTHVSQYAISYVHKTFADIGSFPWAQKQIEVLASKGVINGVTESSYSPSAYITRADFITLLVRGLGLSATVQSNFEDIQRSAYYYEPIGIAKRLGIANGTGNNRFNPNEPITREDMMVLIARALEIADHISSEEHSDVLSGYSDASQMADYAREGIAALIQSGIVQGNQGRINPKDNATRAETAVMIYRIYNTERG